MHQSSVTRHFKQSTCPQPPRLSLRCATPTAALPVSPAISLSPCRVLGPLTRHAVHLLLRRRARLPGAGGDAVHTLTRVTVVQPGVAAVLTRLTQLGTLLQRTTRLRGGQGDELRCSGCGGVDFIRCERVIEDKSYSPCLASETQHGGRIANKGNIHRERETIF